MHGMERILAISSHFDEPTFKECVQVAILFRLQQPKCQPPGDLTVLRTHTCGQLNTSNKDETVTICGWVDSIRDLGGSKFIDIRDRYGCTQVVVNPTCSEEVLRTVKKLHNECVVQIKGKVILRPEGQTNPKISTGEIEIQTDELSILNPCKTPPFLPSQRELPNENLRLKHRYLDLRRKSMQDTLVLRNRIIKSIRDYFAENNFIDVETPILGRSTPEGARDYLVPSRVQKGQFYALPQSPQIYKQLMMIAGYDRYVQVARCFRDEDLRADRQPEFTQLDMEMSFVDSDDVMGMIDGLVKRLANEILGIDVEIPLKRLTFDEAMRRFGHDAPDLRFGMEIVDCTDIAKRAEFRVFRECAESGHFVRGINVKAAADGFSRKRIDEFTSYVQQNFAAKGLAWFKVDADSKLASGIAKNFGQPLLEEMRTRMDGQPGDLLLFIADSWDVSCKVLHGLRKRLGAELQLYDPREMAFSWVVEFPMFHFNEEENRWDAMHHPFTAPLDQDLATLGSEPGQARAKAYDLIINGNEAGGGTIRIHDSQTQRKVFQLLGLDEHTARDRFGFLLDALTYGAPPHGGIALGIDRIVMLFGRLENIRDCIAFPKTQRATDLMTEAPSAVDKLQLDELGIEVSKPAEIL